MIEAKDISKSYGNLKVLNHVDFKVDSGEIVSIVGASGAGKSTLLHILGTLDKPDSGRLHYGDVEVGALSSNRLAQFRNQSIGFIFQFHHLLPEFTALENVSIPGLIGRLDKEVVKLKALELLALLGLESRANHKPSELSGGEQQRVAVARSLINNPAVIFADEPSGNLDSVNAGELHKLFFDLRDRFSQTFVIVTHNDELADMADRKLTMRDGNILS